MSKNGSISVGLMGLGVVGGGFARALKNKQLSISARVGCDLSIKRVLVRDISKYAREGFELTDNAQEILNDPEIRIVVETIGGEHPALEYILEAIRAGKHVVTANKEVIAKHGYDIFNLAEKHAVSVGFEASVGGGIPIIRPLLQDLLVNDIDAVHAIINGTTNYILTSMSRDGLDFETALSNAQKLGYAEADPASDIEGLDAAYKLAILTALAFHCQIKPNEIYQEGITALAAEDFRYAAELGYVIKLLAISRKVEGFIQARVHPAFVPMVHSLSKIEGVLNAIELQGDLVGHVVFHGAGAGELPTTSAVTGDVLDIARSIALDGRRFPPPNLESRYTVQDIPELETKYYLRLRANDMPGVMAQITRVLGDHQVSLASVIQKETIEDNGLAEIVITTHFAKESGVQKAVKELSELDVVKEVCNLIRIEELD